VQSSNILKRDSTWQNLDLELQKKPPLPLFILKPCSVQVSSIPYLDFRHFSNHKVPIPITNLQSKNAAAVFLQSAILFKVLFGLPLIYPTIMKIKLYSGLVGSATY